MNRHLRLWAIMLTAFMLVGVMGTVAMAADHMDLSGTFPKGNVYVTDKYKMTFQVSFDSSADQKAAKVKWTAKNLPAGLKLTANNTKATIEGTLSKASKSPDDAKNTYEISAVDSVSGFDWTSSDTVVVWGKPEFKTDPSKNIVVTAGSKGIKFKIDTKDPVASYDVKVSKDTAITATSGWSVPGYNPAATSQILLDEEKTKSNSLAFTGSFDRVLSGSAKYVTMTVTVKVPSGDIGTTQYREVSKDFKLEIKGVAPKFNKMDFTFSETDTSGDIALKEGTPEIQWKAYIDAKTVEKLTGKKNAKAIVLSKDAYDYALTGLKFVTSTDGTAAVYFAPGSADKVAFKKLPITVEAWNDKVNKTKHSNGKITVTVDGDDPTLIANNATLAIFHPATDPSYDKAVISLDTIDNTFEVKIKAGASFDTSYFIISADGSKPLAITVKPDKKNGIAAKVSGDAVYFNGTADSSVKKDTAVKFTVEAKNASTGKKAKANVIFHIVPKPKLASGQNTITPKAVVYGKNVKVAPKLDATNKTLTWVISDVSLDRYASVGAGSADQEKVITSLDNYGLTFDPNKGTISGKVKYTTGKDKPFVIKYKASGDLESADAAVTATITVLGEPVKLTTKAITITLNSADTEAATKNGPVNLLLSTNLANITSADHRASVDWTLDLKSIKGKEITSASVKVSGDTAVGGVAQLSVDLSTAKVAKKVSVPVKFKNYGTESTGKFTITIEGATPVISGDAITVAKAGGTGKTTINVKNPALVSSKLKWTVSKPSVNGITAKLAADKSGTKATLEVKVGDKVEDGSDSVTVKVKDSVTGEESEEITIPITITNPYRDTSSALEATDDSAALDGEAKVLGEGDVYMGFQRTVASLTPDQKAKLEAQGYIVAAVLPEIEVTADGQYDFEVELDADEKVKAGAELVWFAFASKPTTDDEIVDFEDLEGNEIEVVPAIAEGHEYPVVVAWPWLNEGTKYAPVIAVKAPADEADAMTEDGVKEKAEEAKEEK